MDRSNSVPRLGSKMVTPQMQGQSYRTITMPQESSNSQMKFINDLVQQQPNSYRSAMGIPQIQGQSYRATQQSYLNPQTKQLNDLIQYQSNSQRQAVGQQFEQLSPGEINQFQRQFENGQILNGLSTLQNEANMTQKLMVQMRQQQNQLAQPIQYVQTPPSLALPPPQPIIYVQSPPTPTTPPVLPSTQKYIMQYCSECLNKDQILKQQETKIEYLLEEMNKMSRFLVDKSQEIELWKRQYMSIQTDLSRPKVIDNSEKYLKEINDLKNKLNSKDKEIISLKTNINQMQEKLDQDQDQLQLRARNNDEGDLEQLQKDLYDAQQEIEIYKEDNDRLNNKLANLEASLQNKKTEITTVYKSDPEMERQLKELRQKYTVLQSQYYTLQDTSKIVQKEIQYETKVIYQPDPETEKLLQKKIQQYEELYSRYVSLQDQYASIQQKQLSSVYETKTIYKPDPETERQLQIKIEQYNQLYQRYNQLQNQYYQLEDRSKMIQKEIQYETKIVYQPDPETERLLKLKIQQLESMTSKCTMLQGQIEMTKTQIEQYQTRIYQFETRKSESENNQIQVEQLKEQLRRANSEIEQYTRKIYQLESNNEQTTFFKKQTSDLKMQFEQEQQLTIQLKRKIEEMKAEQSKYETYKLRIRELEVLVQQKEDRIRQIQLELDQYRSDMMTYQQRISSYQVNIDNNEALKQQILQWREKYEQLEQKQRYQNNEEVNQWKIRYEQIEQRYVSLQQSYETIQITLKQYQENEQSEVLKLEIKRLQKTIVELRSEIDRLLIQASDNQWLSQRNEEQQLLIEQYKSQLEERQSVQREYKYEIQNVNQRNEHASSQKIVTTTQQSQSYPSITQQTKTVEYNSIQPKMSQYSSYQSRPVEHTSVQQSTQQRQTYQQSHFKQPSQVVLMNEQKKSRAEQEFSSQRWNDNYGVVFNEVTQKEKLFS
ncbi:unnamed protein product [Paramecium sonneborni]|uniref:Uncharacterized protein n=1 Tax=Paramecium sonneborni TaxID=65129 RepID=A0A8S1PID9_9CILI|nr:unnamed protein product [Paramecium sonneborni]